jgi:DNA mismatch repair ATPase MutL
MKLIMSILAGHAVKDDDNNAAQGSTYNNEGKKYYSEQSVLPDLFQTAKAAESPLDLSGDVHIEAPAADVAENVENAAEIPSENAADNAADNVADNAEMPDLSHLSGAEMTSLLGNQQKDDPDFATRMFQSLLANAPGKKVEYKRDDGDWLAENFGITYLEAYDSKPQQLFDAESNLFLALKPLGQLNNSYIIATLGEDLYVIDQHAAHERILYEEFVLAFALDSRETSLLAVPVSIDVGDLHAELLLNNIARLADFGFVLEHFGGSSFVIRGVPLWYVRGSESDNRRKSQVYDNDIAGFFLEVFDMLLESADDDVLDIARLNQLELFTKACKSAIKANEHLNGQEISWLLYNLAECEKPQTCPHGRPTFFKMSDSEIRKRFMRS